MNGVISLVHFCETHGPTVMFCTQGVHKDQPSWSLINFSKPSLDKGAGSEHNLPGASLDQGGINNYLGGLSYASNLYSTSLYNPVLSSFPSPAPINDLLSNSRTSNKMIGSTATTNLKPNHSSSDINNYSHLTDTRLRNSSKSNLSQCPTCSPRFPTSAAKNTDSQPSDNGLGYLSQDPLNPDTIFTTTRYPSHPRLYAALRQACVRSLSCEFCPGREGPILFGDEKHGYTLSYMFKIRDDRARGSQRFYALSLLMTDRLYLIASTTYLISKFRSLARFLQARAATASATASATATATANRGEPEKKSRAQSLQLRPSPQARSQIRSTIIDNPRLVLPLSSSGRSLTGDLPTKFPTGMASMLTSDQFLRRHSSTNTKQLRTLEELLELPHLMATLHASFTVILSSGNRRLLESQPMPLQKWTEPTTVLMDVLPLSRLYEHTDSQVSSPSSVGSSVGSTCLTPRFHLDHLGQLYHILGRSQFGKLLFNFVIGNQIVIRSSSQAIIQDIMVVLEDILPQLCFRKLEYETVYQPIWVCNLLGLSRDSPIPNEVDLTSLVLLEVDAPGYGSRSLDSITSNSNTLMALSYGVNEPVNSSPFPDFVSEVVEIVQQCDYSLPGLSPMDPSHHITYNLLPSKPPSQVFGFNAAKSFDCPHLSPKQIRLKLIALKEAWSCKGRMLAHFLRQSHLPKPSLSGDPQILLPRLLQILRITKEDLPVARFFATAFRPRSIST